jgi:hypothetical protein
MMDRFVYVYRDKMPCKTKSIILYDCNTLIFNRLFGNTPCGNSNL